MTRAALVPVYTEVPTMGLDGRGVLSGARAPLPTDGRIGDFWLDTASKKLYGAKTAAGWPDRGLIRGASGWTPLERIVADGSRQVVEIYDWTGGEGTKPAVGYKTASGAVSADIEDGADVRGAEGPQALINGLDAGDDDLTLESLTATAESTGDNEKQPLKNVLGAAGALPFDTVAAASALEIPKSVKTVWINGATADEGGPGHLRRRVNVEPTSGPKHRSADRFTADGGTDSANGGWWRVVDGVSWPRGPGIIRSAQDIARNGWALFDFIDPSKHSNIRDGSDVSDLTIALQSAIDSGEELKAGRGKYHMSGVDVPTKTRLRGDGRDKVTFILANGSNRSAFKIPMTDVGAGDFEQPLFEDFFLDANGNNQTGTSHGIELPSATFGLGDGYGSSITANRIQVESAKSSAFWSGTNRNTGIVNDCIFRYSLSDVLVLNGYDWNFKGGCVGGSGIGTAATGNTVTIGAGGAIAFLGTNIFSAPEIGVAISGFVNSYVHLLGCSLDLHGREALAASGATGQSVVVSGGRIGSNSKEGANTYPHVRFSNTGDGNAILGTVFERGDPAAKHLVEFQGACKPIGWRGLYGVGGEAPYATSLTNDFTKLKFAGSNDAGWFGPLSVDSAGVGYGDQILMKIEAELLQIYKATRFQAETPRIWLQETDAAANSGRYMLDVDAGELRLFLVDDAETTFVKVLSLTRSGTALGRLGLNVTGGKFALPGLPTSATGLSSGDLWNDAGTIKIVP